MISEENSDYNSLISEARLPSLLALRCFESAARFENFARAADELHLTPGAISRAVRLLEEDLGAELFERRSRRVFLTDTGRRLAKAVSEGLGLMNQAVRKIRSDARRARRLVLSCEPTLLMRWLIPRWSDFQTRHPGLDIHLVAGGGPFSFNQGIDLAIRRDDFPGPPVIMPKRFSQKRSALSAAQKNLTYGLVKTETLCAPRPPCFRRLAGLRLGRSGLLQKGYPLRLWKCSLLSTSISASRQLLQALESPLARGTWCATTFKAVC